VAERRSEPGSLVFVKPPGPVPMEWPRWWEYRAGASWRRPRGASGVPAAGRHPVVHVAHPDAVAYAAWAGKELPAEAEWEYAARGGLDGRRYPWGDEPAPAVAPRANTWQGVFPWYDASPAGYGTTEVGAFPANGYGLFDVVGNVWEWTCDEYRAVEGATATCCPGGEGEPRMVVKGGSFACAPNYCHRYRPAARQPHAAQTSACHLGFRCVRR
jgi:formylglycine-generating enzyme required for sulfatase activity